MKMDRGAARPNLYPDLSEFFTQSAPDSASSPPPHPPQRLQPTAPPLQEARHNLHPREDHIPEEPEEDYLLDEVSVRGQGVSRGGGPHSMAHHSTSRCPWREDIGDLTVDYSLGDITVDYSLDEISLEDLLELEPDYDDADDLPQDSQRLSRHLNHNHLNNLNLLTASAKKTLREKNIEVPEPPRDDRDYGAWVKWRMQTNKLLAALVLSRRGQRRVMLRESELRRKPLTRHNVEKVVQQARGGAGGGGGAGGRRKASPAERTSLPACPYVMYGIPRVTLPPAGASQP